MLVGLPLRTTSQEGAGSLELGGQLLVHGGSPKKATPLDDLCFAWNPVTCAFLQRRKPPPYWHVVPDAHGPPSRTQVRRRKILEDYPVAGDVDFPVTFDLSMIPTKVWITRFHLPEAEMINGRASMIGFFAAWMVDAVFHVGIADQMGSPLGKLLLVATLVGCLFVRRNEDYEGLKGLADEATFYDRQWCVPLPRCTQVAFGGCSHARSSRAATILHPALHAAAPHAAAAARSRRSAAARVAGASSHGAAAVAAAAALLPATAHWGEKPLRALDVASHPHTAATCTAPARDPLDDQKPPGRRRQPRGRGCGDDALYSPDPSG
jgi:hypothetical protein